MTMPEDALDASEQDNEMGAGFDAATAEPTEGEEKVTVPPEEKPDNKPEEEVAETAEGDEKAKEDGKPAEPAEGKDGEESPKGDEKPAESATDEPEELTQAKALAADGEPAKPAEEAEPDLVKPTEETAADKRDKELEAEVAERDSTIKDLKGTKEITMEDAIAAAPEDQQQAMKDFVEQYPDSGNTMMALLKGLRLWSLRCPVRRMPHLEPRPIPLP